MNFKIVIPVLLLSLCGANSTLAKVNLNRKVSLIGKDFSADEFLKEVSKQTHVKFEIDPDADLPKSFSIVVKDAPLKSVLDTFALKQEVTWSLIGEDTIQISPQKTEVQ